MRQGQSQRQVARRHRVSLRAVQYWLQRAGHEPLDQIDWSDRPPIPHHSPHKISPALERRIVATRRALAQSPLGFVGALSIAQALSPGLREPLPSLRTIGRVLRRQGVLDGLRRWRRPPPPPGWYLPAAAGGRAELDAWDFIEDLCLAGGRWVHVLTSRALAGPGCGAWPASGAGTTARVLEALPAHWRRHGRPAFAQFDNDLRFLGPSRYPDTLGQVVRLCLQLDVTPVFAPPAEHGLQNLIESFNALWQAKVWDRFQHANVPALVARSDRFVTALWQRRAARSETAPARRPWPRPWQFHPQAPLRGQIIFIRRTDAHGRLHLLGHVWELDPTWPQRLVRAEVDLDAHQIRCYRLRRLAPQDQPLIKIIPYRLPHRHRTDG